MAQPQLYRDYSQWILAMEPKLAWVHLSRTQFRQLVGVVLFFFVFFAVLLVSRMAVIKCGYQIVELRLERDRLLAAKKQNEHKLRDLMSLEHAEAVARQEMGMVDINPNQVIYISDPAKPGMTKRAWNAVFGD